MNCFVRPALLCTFCRNVCRRNQAKNFHPNDFIIRRLSPWTVLLLVVTRTIRRLPVEFRCSFPIQVIFQGRTWGFHRSNDRPTVTASPRRKSVFDIMRWAVQALCLIRMLRRLNDDAICMFAIFNGRVNLQLGNQGRGRVIGPMTNLPKRPLVRRDLMYFTVFNIAQRFPLFIYVPRSRIMMGFLANLYV